jgi:hypothetical protein
LTLLAAQGAARAPIPGGRCAVCKVQKKGRCGTAAAHRNCLRRTRARGGTPPPGIGASQDAPSAGAPGDDESPSAEVSGGSDDEAAAEHVSTGGAGDTDGRGVRGGASSSAAGDVPAAACAGGEAEDGPAKRARAGAAAPEGACEEAAEIAA